MMVAGTFGVTRQSEFTNVKVLEFFRKDNKTGVNLHKLITNIPEMLCSLLVEGFLYIICLCFLFILSFIFSLLLPFFCNWEEG
jgi:hypothetical protein